MPLARHQLNEAASWWVVNRPDSPHALAASIRRALSQIGESPGIGRPAPETGHSDVRRYLVRRVNYHVFYRVTAADMVEILAVWHASRGSGPPI
jgi:plasmid stabilization system protein ParE